MFFNELYLVNFTRPKLIWITEIVLNILTVKSVYSFS